MHALYHWDLLLSLKHLYVLFKFCQVIIQNKSKNVQASSVGIVSITGVPHAATSLHCSNQNTQVAT